MWPTERRWWSSGRPRATIHTESSSWNVEELVRALPAKLAQEVEVILDVLEHVNRHDKAEAIRVLE
jgi:hypothetical protein